MSSKGPTGKAKAAPKKVPKPKAKAASVPIDSDESDADDAAAAHESRMLRPPKKEFSGDKSAYPNWRRSMFVWRNKFPHVDEKQIGANLMEVILGDAEDAVFGNIADGEETFTNIIKALDGPYGERSLAASTQYVREFKELKRGKKSLEDFLSTYKTARAKAIRFGWTPSPDTDGMDLIMACEITSTQQTTILQTLQLKAEILGKEFARPEYATAYDALETLASTLAMQDSAKRVEKRPAGLLSATEPVKRQRTGEQPKGPGKGLATGGPKGPGAGKGVCNQFAQSGKCSYGETCRFHHDKGKHGKKDDGKGKKGKGPGGGKPKTAAPCRQWTKDGTCTYGESCRFSHT